MWPSRREKKLRAMLQRRCKSTGIESIWITEEQLLVQIASGAVSTGPQAIGRRWNIRVHGTSAEPNRAPAFRLFFCSPRFFSFYLISIACKVIVSTEQVVHSWAAAAALRLLSAQVWKSDQSKTSLDRQSGAAGREATTKRCVSAASSEEDLQRILDFAKWT